MTATREQPDSATLREKLAEAKRRFAEMNSRLVQNYISVVYGSGFYAAQDDDELEELAAEIEGLTSQIQGRRQLAADCQIRLVLDHLQRNGCTGKEFRHAVAIALRELPSASIVRGRPLMLVAA